MVGNSMYAYPSNGMRRLLIVLYKSQVLSRELEVVMRWDPHDPENKEKWEGGYRFTVQYECLGEYTDLDPADAGEIIEAVRDPIMEPLVPPKTSSDWNFGDRTFHIYEWNHRYSWFNEDLKLQVETVEVQYAATLNCPIGRMSVYSNSQDDCSQQAFTISNNTEGTVTITYNETVDPSIVNKIMDLLSTLQSKDTNASNSNLQL
jgi:hypothetical protein